MISKEDIKKIEETSMIKFEGKEKQEIIKKIEESLSRIQCLEEVDTEDVEPLYQVFDYNQKLREDKYNEEMALTRDEVLQNTEEKEYGYFKLLNIMD